MMDFSLWLKLAPVAAVVFFVTLAVSVVDFLTKVEKIRPRFILSAYQVVHKKEYYRLFTGALIHGDWMHLFINMLVFYSFAPVTEHFIGHWQFFVLYWGSELISTMPDLVRHRHNPNYYSLGASGAISGLMFSCILFAPTSEFLVFFFIPMPAWLFGILYLAYSQWAARRGGDGINNYAHFWGAIGGLVLTALLAPNAFVNFVRQLGLM